MIGYSDSGFAGNLEDDKSSTGQLLFLDNMAITWGSMNQKVGAISPCPE